MTKKLRNLAKLRIDPGNRKYLLLPNILLVILYMFTISQMSARTNETENSSVIIEDFPNTPKIIKSYKISDASTVNKSCFPTKGEGVIFQRGLGGNCGGLHHIWRVKDELIFNEYDDDTATIKGSVIDDDGKTGIVNIKLSDKVQTGNTWPAQCYENGISDPRELYRDFNGNITINGISFTVNPISSGQHYIVADGAGFEPGEFGVGGWTGGSFGSCTEWFGKLEEIEIRCDVTANAGIDVSIAFGDSTTLTATGGGSYIWSTGETTASITVIPTVTTTYSVMVTSTDGDCTDADQVIVTVDCVMEADLGDDLQFCNENETILTANVTNVPTYAKIITAYNITDADTSTGICANVHGNEQGVILQRNNPLFPITGRYNAWRVYDGLVLNEYDNQTAKIEGSVIDENGNVGIVDILLFDKQNQGLSWLKQCYLDGMVGPQLFYQSFHGTITVNGLIYTVEPKNTGQHFILAEGASLEPNQFGFGAWTAGTFGAGGEWFGNLDPIDIEDCEAVTYLWSTGETTESITVTESGEYTVTVNTCNDCQATDTIKVDFFKAKANAGDDKTICTGDSTTLTATGGGSYLWSTGETTASIKVSPTADTIYTVTVTSSDGCKDTDVVKVSLHPEVTANAGADVAICKDEEVTLTATGGGTYLWSTGETTASIKVSPMADTTYSVTVTSNQGCEDTDDVKVSLHPEVTANAGSDVAICKDEEVMLTATGGGSYLWSTGETTASIKVSPTADTIYTVTVTSSAGCKDVDEVKVSLHPEVTANAGADVAICKDEEVTLTATGGGTYLWSTGETTATINVSPMADTTYSVTVTSNEGCEDTDDVKVSLHPEVTANAGSDVAICEGDEVTLTANGGGSYLWSTGETTASIKVSPTNDTAYAVTVTSNEGCEDTDEVKVSVGYAYADAGADQTICEGEEVMLSVKGKGKYLWSTGEITQSIKVSPKTTMEYSVIVTNGICEAMDEVMVNVDKKVIIGDYVWLDENRNGIQDDGNTGINGISVKLYECNGDLVDETDTNADGYYEFKVCPESGDYHIVFGEIPEELKFTSSNEGNDDSDSDADTGGVTSCFTINDKNDLTIDAGLVEICNISLDVVDETKICINEVLELSATLTENTDECEGGCVYPVIKKGRCAETTPDNEILLFSMNNGNKFYNRFHASEQRFETLDDGSARYTATATDGIDNIEVDVRFTGHSMVPGPMGPKPNECQQYDMSDWEFWSTWSGTISSQNHGIFTLSMKGAYFQMGIGADVTKSGFGASGWFFAEGGDGHYTSGDINIALDECIEKNIAFEWTTADGNIISDSNQKTIAIDSPGTYIIKAVNCIDCVAVETIVVTQEKLCSKFAKSTVTPKISKVYPVPVKSGGVLTVEFNTNSIERDGTLKSTNLKASVENKSKSTKENVTVMIYDMMGRVVSVPQKFDLINGKAIIYIDLDYIQTGNYIVKAMGGTWSNSKNIIVR